MIQRKGLLLVTMEPSASFEDEFNDWYDTEHVPQRRSLVGFETAQRFTCITGWPRYLALYDLTSPSVVESEAYQAISGAHSTPWSQRMLAHVVGYYRIVAEQVYPGDASTGDYYQVMRLVFVRFSRIAAEQENMIVERLCRIFNQQPGLTRLRVFKSARLHTYDFLGLAEFHAPFSESNLTIEVFGESDLHMDLINTYAPYWRSNRRS